MINKSECYGVDGQESLDFDPHDSFTGYVESVPNPKDIKYPVKILVFKRMDVYINEDRLLEDLLETLDEEFGHPEDETIPTEEMRKATKEFADKIKKIYTPWACEQTEDYFEFNKEGDVINEYRKNYNDSGASCNSSSDTVLDVENKSKA